VVKDDEMRIHLGANSRPISFEYYTENLETSQTTSATYYYHYDLHGNVIRVTNSSGTSVITYTYDPLGNILTESNSSSIYNPFTYMGEAQVIHDSEFDTSSSSPLTGLYNAGSGYYNPETGTFIQGSGVPATTNPTSIDFETPTAQVTNPVEQSVYEGVSAAIEGGEQSDGTAVSSNDVIPEEQNEGLAKAEEKMDDWSWVTNSLPYAPQDVYMFSDTLPKPLPPPIHPKGGTIVYDNECFGTWVDYKPDDPYKLFVKQQADMMDTGDACSNHLSKLINQPVFDNLPDVKTPISDMPIPPGGGGGGLGNPGEVRLYGMMNDIIDWFERFIGLIPPWTMALISYISSANYDRRGLFHGKTKNKRLSRSGRLFNAGKNRYFNNVVDLSRDIVDILIKNYEISDDFTITQLYKAVQQAIIDWDVQNGGIEIIDDEKGIIDYPERSLDETCKSGLMKFIVDRLFGTHSKYWKEEKGDKSLYNGGYLSQRKRKDAYDPGFP
jgi:YD repeat-containing protein